MKRWQDRIFATLLLGSVLFSVWFMWFFAWRSLVSSLVTIGVEG